MRKLLKSYIVIGCSFLMCLGLTFVWFRNFDTNSQSDQNFDPAPVYYQGMEERTFYEGIGHDYLPLGPFIKGKLMHVVPDAPMFKMMY